MKKIISLFVVIALVVVLAACVDKTDIAGDVNEDWSKIQGLINIAQVTTSNLNLITHDSPEVIELGIAGSLLIVWESQNTTAITNEGVVTSQFVDVSLQLVVTADIRGEIRTRSYATRVPGKGGEAVFALVWNHIDSLMPNVALDDVSLLAEFPTGIVGTDPAAGIAITWTSNNPEVMSNLGVVTMPDGEVEVTLTASITIEGITQTRQYFITVGYDSDLAVMINMATNPGKVIEWGDANLNADLRTIIAAAFDRGAQTVMLEDFITRESFPFIRTNSILVDRITPTSNNNAPATPDWPTSFAGGVGFLVGPAIRAENSDQWATASIQTSFAIDNLSEINFSIMGWASDMFFQLFHSDQVANPRYLEAINVQISENGTDWTTLQNVLPPVGTPPAEGTQAYTTYRFSVTLDEPGDYFVRIEFLPIQGGIGLTERTFNLRMILTEFSLFGDRPASPEGVIKNAAATFLQAFMGADANAQIAALSENATGFAANIAGFANITAANQALLVALLEKVLVDNFQTQVDAMIAKTADLATIAQLASLVSDTVGIFNTFNTLSLDVDAAVISVDPTQLAATVMKGDLDALTVRVADLLDITVTEGPLGDALVAQLPNLVSGVEDKIDAGVTYLDGLTADQLTLRAGSILATEILSGTPESVLQAMINLKSYFPVTNTDNVTLASMLWLLQINGLAAGIEPTPTTPAALSSLLLLVQENTTSDVADAENLFDFVVSSADHQATIVAAETSMAAAFSTQDVLLPSVTEAVKTQLDSQISGITPPDDIGINTLVVADLTQRLTTLQTQLTDLDNQFGLAVAGVAINVITSNSLTGSGGYLDTTFNPIDSIHETRFIFSGSHSNLSGRTFTFEGQQIANPGVGIASSIRTQTPVAPADNTPSGLTAGHRHTVVGTTFPIRGVTSVTFNFYVWGANNSTTGVANWGDAANQATHLNAIFIQTSLDGVTWTTQGDNRVPDLVLQADVADYGQSLTATFDAIDGYVRLVVQAPEGSGTLTGQFRTVITSILISGLVVPQE